MLFGPQLRPWLTETCNQTSGPHWPLGWASCATWAPQSYTLGAEFDGFIALSLLPMTDLVTRPVVRDGDHVSLIAGREIHAPRHPKHPGEVQASPPHRRRVHHRGHLRKVLHQNAVVQLKYKRLEAYEQEIEKSGMGCDLKLGTPQAKEPLGVRIGAHPGEDGLAVSNREFQGLRQHSPFIVSGYGKWCFPSRVSTSKVFLIRPLAEKQRAQKDNICNVNIEMFLATNTKQTLGDTTVI